MSLIDIIVPVYNTEEYLSQCIESVLNQDFEDWRLICVNDGSKDNSLNILESYAKRDPRIIVISQENTGLSGARNNGLRHAEGKYVMFLDSDDWLSNSCLGELSEWVVKEEADLYIWNYVREYGNSTLPKVLFQDEKIKFSRSEVLSELLLMTVGPIGKYKKYPERINIMNTVCTKLYKRSLIYENNILFEDSKKVGTIEDAIFNIDVFHYAMSAIYLNKDYYHYRRDNLNSLTHGLGGSIWIIDKGYQVIEGRLMKYQYTSKYYEAYYNRIVMNALGLGLTAISASVSWKDKKNKIKEILKEQIYREAAKQFRLSHLPLHWKVFYFCAKYQLVIPLAFMLKIINKMTGKI